MPSARASSWPPGTTTGTAACSCSARAAICRSWSASRPRWRACARPPCARARATWTSRASTPASFEACPSDSIDYAVMEKTADAVVVPLDAGWSDVGSWASLHEASDSDAHGNVARGDVISEDTHGSLPVRREPPGGDRRAARPRRGGDQGRGAGGAEGPRAGRASKLVARLKASGRYEHSLHREVFRPWGSYDSLETGERFQVKRLKVKPGAALSLQMHHHRAEHWIVVSGTARITRGEEVFLLEENQSTYIPVGVKHRIENPGTIPLQIIEVQSGSLPGRGRHRALRGRVRPQGHDRLTGRAHEQSELLQGLRRPRPHSRRDQRGAGLRHRTAPTRRSSSPSASRSATTSGCRARSWPRR